MDLKLDLWKDKEGIHCVDAISGYGLHWMTTDDARAWIKEHGGEPWEQSFRAAMAEIATKIPGLDKPIEKKDFTFTPAKSVTTWP